MSGVNEQTKKAIQASVDSGLAQLGMCNAVSASAMNTLVKDINAAFQKAAEASVKTGGSSTIM